MNPALPDRKRDRRRLAMVIGGVVAATTVGVVIWTLAPRAPPQRAAGGPELSIAIVAPVEPVTEAGDILEVGQLTDGFDRQALERQADATNDGYLPPDAYAGEDWQAPTSAPAPARWVREFAPTTEPIVTPTDPLADGSRLFGFDRPVASRVGSAATTPSDPAKASEEFFE